MVDFVLVIIKATPTLVGEAFIFFTSELFSLGAVVLSQYTRLTDGQTDMIAIACVTASQSHAKKDSSKP